MNRSEHVEWAKKRAMEYIDDGGDVIGAYSSMASDLQKHPETADHIAIGLGMQMMMIGKLQTAEEMRHFIDGFH